MQPQSTPGGALTPNTNRRLPEIVILVMFFFSGACGLMYQVVWSRLMTQVFGSTAEAVGTVLAAFMTGLALGAWLFGRLADRGRNNLRLYALLEFGIAFSALLAHFLLQQINPAQVIVHEWFGQNPALFGLLRFVLAFLLIVAPTVLMGATLPVLTRFMVDRTSRVGIRLSSLYAINTLGAVTGVALTGFFLIGAFGVHLPVYLAAAGNLALGAIAWLVSRPFESHAQAPQGDSLRGPATAESVDRLTWRVILAGLGISGLTSFAYEIFWTRSLVFILGNSTYALSTMLCAFLTGIALGAWLVRFVLRREIDRCAVFGWAQVLLGLFSAFALPLLFAVDDPQALYQWLLRSSDQVMPLILARFGIALLVMLVPAILIGATFPLVSQLGVTDWRTTGSRVGEIYSVNTVGNVLGALLPGLLLLNWLGIQKGILAMAALNVGVGFLVLLIRLAGPGGRPAWRIALPALMALSAFLMSRLPLDFQFPSDGEQASHQTVYYREGPLATTKVYWDPKTMERLMSVDGIVIGGTGFSEFKQLLLAHLPKLLIEDVSTELSVGLGSGILAGESALHPDVREITVVEIEPSVIEGAHYFARQNHAVLDNPAVSVVNDDIGNFLRTRNDRYRVISADEKTADDYASNGFSYSLDYYRLLLEHLAPGGLVAQWVPTTLPPSQYRMILNSFVHGFPHVQLWYFLPAYKRGPVNTLLIGSAEKIPLDFGRIRDEFGNHGVALRNLIRYGLNSAESLLPHFVADEATLRRAVESDPVNSLDHPRYEFFQPWEYARDREQKFLGNHEFLLQLRRAARADFLAGLELEGPQRARMERTLDAEEEYLEGFAAFLGGASLNEQFRIFDSALARAPWNDSLRARIYAQYSFLASTARDPRQRAALTERANRLYRGR
jgi:spermidine synthase